MIFDQFQLKIDQIRPFLTEKQTFQTLTRLKTFQLTSIPRSDWILTEFLLCFDCILTEFWLNSDCILAAFWLRFDWILTGFWLDFNCILTAFWQHFDCILTAFWLNFDCFSTRILLSFSSASFCVDSFQLYLSFFLSCFLTSFQIPLSFLYHHWHLLKSFLFSFKICNFTQTMDLEISQHFVIR